MLEHTYDYGLTGHIQTWRGVYDLMISHITGKTRVDSRACIAYENALQKNDGLFLLNNGTKDLNSGKWDNHWYSSINRKSGIWQNPWTGVEDLHWSSELVPPFNFI